jgi:protein phosphatase
MPVTGYDQIEHASLTDVGIRRSHNQDAHAALLASDAQQWEKRGHVFLVADGMGAHAVGELASELAAGIIPHAYHKYSDEEDSGQALRKAFVEANGSIHARGQQNREFAGMGTTASALLIRPEGAWIAHVGDSRVYRIRRGHIEQLSYDHSLAWELARRKGVQPDGLEGVPSNVIVRSLGPEPLVQVDIEGPHVLREGDTFVICSDGLSGTLSDLEIGSIASALPPAEACQFLVAMANLRGGPDNITVIVIRIGAAHTDPTPEPAPDQSWYQRTTWPVIALVLGVLLAAGAVNVSATQFGWGMVVFVLAAASLVIGLAGLVFHYRQEHKSAEESGPRRVNIYRRSTCQIERRFLDKLARLENALIQTVRERCPDMDWATHQYHHALSERQRAANDMVGACRESCRAILPLTEALHAQYNKSESFQPMWEKTEK